MISGRTTLIGIVADPIGHVRTPQVFNALMEARGRDVVMVPLHVTAEGLPALMAAAGAIRSLAGLVVTLPHKEAIVAHCSALTPSARRAGAANVVRIDHSNGEIVGTNTDGAGFLAGLAAQGHAVSGCRAYIAGAGGAAKAIAHALAGAGASALGIHNRTRARAEALVLDLRREHPGLDVQFASDRPAEYGLAINATSLGLRPEDPLPFRIDALPADALVAEVVMGTDLTPLLAAAQARGLSVHAGRYMLSGQIGEIASYLRVLEGSAP